MPVYKSDQNADIRLYFVVPDDIYNTFECQDYTTKDNTSKEDRPVGDLNNVEQWAMKHQMMNTTNSITYRLFIYGQLLGVILTLSNTVGTPLMRIKSLSDDVRFCLFQSRSGTKDRADLNMIKEVERKKIKDAPYLKALPVQQEYQLQ
ncbi:14697_t:CDS:2 [Funneliformis geosporum]|nr:14697_t:CDS:2 [Funneliformis geosporum]